MKNTIKLFLAKNGLLPMIDTFRRLPEIISWLSAGCQGIAPPPIKRMVIKSYLNKYQLKNFVETGTHLGDTLANIAYNRQVNTVSIELANNYYKAAKDRFSCYPNVSLLHGDSGKLMPQVVSSLKSPTLFWLDGHYSGGSTAKGDLETPVSSELQSIMQSSIRGHIILIDDVRCFDGSSDYPHLDELLSVIRSDGRYNIEVSTDILRLTPRQQ